MASTYRFVKTNQLRRLTCMVSLNVAHAKKVETLPFTMNHKDYFQPKIKTGTRALASVERILISKWFLFIRNEAMDTAFNLCCSCPDLNKPPNKRPKSDHEIKHPYVAKNIYIVLKSSSHL
jgi:hypothetical protein